VSDQVTRGLESVSMSLSDQATRGLESVSGVSVSDQVTRGLDSVSGVSMSDQVTRGLDSVSMPLSDQATRGLEHVSHRLVVEGGSSIPIKGGQICKTEILCSKSTQTSSVVNCANFTQTDQAQLTNLSCDQSCQTDDFLAKTCEKLSPADESSFSTSLSLFTSTDYDSGYFEKSSFSSIKSFENSAFCASDTSIENSENQRTFPSTKCPDTFVTSTPRKIEHITVPILILPSEEKVYPPVWEEISEIAPVEFGMAEKVRDERLLEMKETIKTFGYYLKWTKIHVFSKRVTAKKPISQLVGGPNLVDSAGGVSHQVTRGLDSVSMPLSDQATRGLESVGGVSVSDQVTRGLDSVGGVSDQVTRGLDSVSMPWSDQVLKTDTNIAHSLEPLAKSVGVVEIDCPISLGQCDHEVQDYRDLCESLSSWWRRRGKKPPKSSLKLDQIWDDFIK